MEMAGPEPPVTGAVACADAADPAREGAAFFKLNALPPLLLVLPPRFAVSLS